MAKLSRVTQKIFGSSAGANQIGKFGSYAAGSPVISSDPTVIQSLSNWLTGWFGAVVGGNSPAIEDMNAVCFVYAYQLAYLMQQGIPEYDSGTTYFTGSLCTSGGVLYRSLQDNNTGNALTNSNFWLQASGLYAGEGSNGTTVLDPSVNPYYVVPATADGSNIHVKTSKGPSFIFLPNPALLEKITIHDIDGVANANPITLGILPTFAWGDNTNFETGAANPPSNQTPFGAYSSPVLVQTNPLAAIAIQSAASYFLDKAGLIWAVGTAANGQLASGDVTPTRSVPTMVAYVSGATMIAAGGNGGYARASSGQLWAWGLNSNGQVGDNTVLSRSLPTLVTGTSSYTAVVAGLNHAMGLTAAGVALAFGKNDFGQLGNNASATVAQSSPVAVVGAPPAFKAIGAGQNHSFGLTSSGTVYTWGINTSGQMGDGTLVTKSSPVLVIGGLTFTQVVAGDNHMLGITSSATLYAWGSNTKGQLGNGNFANQSSPVLVSGNKSWATVVAGVGFSAGLDVSGNIYVWGSNQFGQIASNPVVIAAVSSPVLVTGFPAFSTLYSGCNANTLMGQVNQGFYTVEGVAAAYVCLTQNGRWNVYSDGTNYWMRG